MICKDAYRLQKLDDLLEKNVMQENQEILNELKRKIQNANTALILGSGVSVPAGLPNWQGLIAKCFYPLFRLETLQYGDSSYFEDYKIYKENAGFDNAFSEISNALKEGKGGIGKNTNLLELVGYLLHGVGVFGAEAKLTAEWRLRELVKQACKVTMPTEQIMQSPLGKLMPLLRRQGDKGNISKIITYNFDTLLEFCIEKYNEQSDIHLDYKSYSKFSDVKLGDQGIQIYHVHGCVPTPGFEAGCKESPLVFSEDSYYASEADAISWTYLLQEEFLLHFSCIVMGFSTQDYNFRRIIRDWNNHYNMSNDQRNIHYMFYPIQDVLPELEGIGSESLSDKILLSDKVLLNFILAFKSTYWRDRGIKVIWTSYEDLPCMLDELSDRNPKIE